MEELYCSMCGVEMRNKDAAFGLTRGVIDEGCDGFCMDFDTGWEIFCMACIDEIDIAIAKIAENKRTVTT